MNIPSEVRYRVQAPNSTPRRIRVVALSDNDPEVAACPAYADVEFVRASTFGIGTDRADESWFGEPNIVVFAGREGDDASTIRKAAQRYRERGIAVCVVINPSSGGSKSTADLLRPFSTMMVLPTREGYLDDLLAALGAVSA